MNRIEYEPVTEIIGGVTTIWNSPKEDTLQKISNQIYKILLNKFAKGEIKFIEGDLIKINNIEEEGDIRK